MLKSARFIEDLSAQLGQMASEVKLHDLAYLLRMASEEARANAERIEQEGPTGATPLLFDRYPPAEGSDRDE